MQKHDWFDEYMAYENCANETDDAPSDNSGCLQWGLGALIILFILSELF